jgi:hypothetical protein
VNCAVDMQRPIALRFNNLEHVEDSQPLDLPSHSDDDVDDDFFEDAQPINTDVPVEWENISPDLIMVKMKLLKSDVYEAYGLKAFYKSYTSWEKMTVEQKNKAVAWFRKLSSDVRGIVFFVTIFIFEL